MNYRVIKTNLNINLLNRLKFFFFEKIKSRSE